MVKFDLANLCEAGRTRAPEESVRETVIHHID